jgi:hypothetical protein
MRGSKLRSSTSSSSLDFGGKPWVDQIAAQDGFDGVIAESGSARAKRIDI